MYDYLLNYYLKNRKIVLTLFFFIFSISFYVNLAYFFNKPKQLIYFPPFQTEKNLTQNTHLGAEYYFIAESIASGEGFSNPFQEDTGPTAWMPPLYSLILALFIILFKYKPMVTFCIIFLKNVVLIITGLIIYDIAKITSLRIKPHFVLLIYAIWLLTFFRWFFQLTHDSWLILLFINLLFITAIRIWSKPITWNLALAWGLIGGGSFCTNPMLTFAWILLTVTIFFLHIKNKIHSKKFLLLSLMVFFIISSTWLIRNFLVFDRLILIKSNLFYDAYKSNYIKENGILDEPFLLNYHPVWNAKKDEFSEYKELGEKRFLDLYKNKFFESLKNDPIMFINKIKNRFLAALILYYPYNERYEANFLKWKRFIHVLPFCFIGILLIFRKRCDHYTLLAIFLYAIFLIPYMLITYYIRYSIPLVPLQCLFIFWGVDLLYNKIKSTSI